MKAAILVKSRKPQSHSWLTNLKNFQKLFLLQHDSKLSKKNEKYSNDYSPVTKKEVKLLLM